MIDEMRFGLCIKKTRYRKSQEDRFVNKRSFKGMTYNGCFGVFDGHGGDKAAQFCKERITDMLENHQNIETKTISSITEVF
jgi:serine/threonine protein phosphatase PrpC